MAARPVILSAAFVSAFILLSAPPSLAQTPDTYSCVLTSPERSATLILRLSPHHVAYQRGGAWTDNACAEDKTTCSVDAQGRIRIAGQSMTSPITGDLLFDPASGELAVTIGPPGQQITLTGICSSVAQGLS